jgi:Fe2+ or Zn2+ uptake regulation protein
MTKLAAQMLSLIQNSDKHMTAEEIFMLCKDKGVKISFASVYRNLTNLVESGDVRRVPVTGEPDRFDKTVRAHDHAFCTVCGCVMDVDVGDMEKYLSEKLGDKIESYSLTIKYICPECRAKLKENKLADNAD